MRVDLPMFYCCLTTDMGYKSFLSLGRLFGSVVADWTSLFLGAREFYSHEL